MEFIIEVYFNEVIQLKKCKERNKPASTKIPVSFLSYFFSDFNKNTGRSRIELIPSLIVAMVRDGA